jgi:ketosteroid isomerase-like protein
MSSPGTAETIRTYSSAWRTGDIATIFALYHDSFTLHYPGANRLSGTHRGKEAALAAMREFSTVTKRKLVDLIDVMAGDGYASIIAREQFHVMDDPPVIQRLAVYRIVDGRMHECWMYDGDQALIDRLIG